VETTYHLRRKDIVSLYWYGKGEREATCPAFAISGKGQETDGAIYSYSCTDIVGVEDEIEVHDVPVEQGECRRPVRVAALPQASSSCFCGSVVLKRN